MSNISHFINSKYLLWLLLALPSYEYILFLLYPGGIYPQNLADLGFVALANLLAVNSHVREMLDSSGLLGAQLLVLTLFITPISLMLRPWNWGKKIGLWLLVRRKYLGLAGAWYGLLHTLIYARYASWDLKLIWLEALQWSFGAGWIALILLCVIACTSNQFSILRMGMWWKFIQRISYVAIVFVLLHWALLEFFLDDVLWWGIPLVIAKLIHVYLRYRTQILGSLHKPRRKIKILNMG